MADIFRVIVSGTRTFGWYKLLRDTLDQLLENKLPNVEIVSGCADGADELAEKYAVERGLLCTRFPAHWKLNGKAAGPIRNREMAAYGQALVAFWDGESKGTEDMIQAARKAGLLVRIIRFWPG